MAQLFYTDMGASLEMRDAQGAVTRLPRYGVWKWDAARQKHQVAEVSDDLEALRKTHGDGQLIALHAGAVPDPKEK